MKCPACSHPTRLDAVQPSVCTGCGASVFEHSGKVFDAAAYPRRIDAADVPRLLAEALQRWRAAGRGRLIEVHPVSLPYWLDLDGHLLAAFMSPLEAVSRLSAPSVEAAPARLESMPRSAPPASACRLVLLPAFDVTYSVRGRRFHAILDGLSGEVLADIRPHPWRVRVQILMAAVLVFDVAVFATVAFLAPSNLVRAWLVAALVWPVYGFTNAVLRVSDRRPD